MRLRRLDLTRYGKFTDRSLDFGPAPQDGADFHIIYGPNEAGKSTTMQGWLDLLYGIPAQSRMDFLHPYGTMQLGACIEAGGEQVDLIRTKGRNNTLTDPSGTVLPEAVLQAALGGIDRAGYEAMFSLDDETLEKGGESILSSQGDLGQMLFTASSGLAEMGQALDGLRAQGQAFFKPGGRSGGLADLKKTLAALDQQIAQLDIGAADVARLVQARDQAQEVFDTAEAEQAGTVQQLHLVERQLAALPLMTRLRLVQAELDALPDLPPLPQGWAAEVPALIRDQGQTAVRLEEQAAQITALRNDYDAATDDPDMLALGPAMAAAEALKSDYDGALRDLPARRTEASGTRTRIDDLLRRLGAAGRDPADLLPPAPVVAALRALMERHSGVMAALHTARDEADSAQHRLQGLSTRIAGDSGAPPDFSVLAEVVQSDLRHDPQAALERAQTAADAAQARWQAQLARLAPWQGDGDALAALAVSAQGGLPAADQVLGWRDAIAQVQRDLAQHHQASARITKEADLIAATLSAGAEAGQPSLADAAQLRARREALWATHRASLNAQTADQFEAALRRDDQVTAALAQAQTHARQRAEAQARLAALGHDKAAHDADAVAAQQHLAALQAEFAASLPDGVDRAITPDAFAEWLRRRDSALEAWALWQEAARDLAAARTRQHAVQATLAAALRGAGQTVAADAPFALLAAQARVVLERAQGQAALVEARDTAVADLARRNAALERAQTALAQWQEAWRAACARSFLADSQPDVATMGETLDLLQQLERAWSDLRGLEDRITKMQANRAAFEAAVAALVTRLD
ncbi:MAG: AAA family ATPase, partial [Rhodobacterales bacterium]